VLTGIVTAFGAPRATARKGALRRRRSRASRPGHPFSRRLGLEVLEDRRLLAVGDLLQTLIDPVIARQRYTRFGDAVASDGNLTVVGTPCATVGGVGLVGLAYVFDSSTGALVATLNNPTPAQDEFFGESLAISGTTVVVGSPYDDTGAWDAGSAYVFDATTGNLLRTLSSPAPASGEFFGASVGISGSTIVVGTPGDNASATDAGSAYVFDAESGTLLRTLGNPTPAADDWFGASVAVAGSTVVVGSPYDDTGAPGAGSAYVFDATTGALVWTLNNPTPADADHFGLSVALAENSVVVGSSSDDTGATDAGSAYVFSAATGDLLWTLNNPTPAERDSFACSVAISGSTVVVGSLSDDTGAVDAGSAYVFDADTGSLLRTVNNPTPAAYELVSGDLGRHRGCGIA